MKAQAALANARVHNFPGGDVLDFDDPVDRVAAFLHRCSFETPDGAMSMATSVSGQVNLATTWSRLSVADRQLGRRRAGGAGELLLAGRELRARPEDNAA